MDILPSMPTQQIPAKTSSLKNSDFHSMQVPPDNGDKFQLISDFVDNYASNSNVIGAIQRDASLKDKDQKPIAQKDFCQLARLKLNPGKADTLYEPAAHNAAHEFCAFPEIMLSRELRLHQETVPAVDYITRLKEMTSERHILLPSINVAVDERQLINEADDFSIVQQDLVECIETGEDVRYHSKYISTCSAFNFIKHLNPAGTVLALIALCSTGDTADPTFAEAVKDANALSLLINLVETDERRCKVAALRLLRKLTSLNQLSRKMIQQGIVKTLIYNLQFADVDVKCLSTILLSLLGLLKEGRSEIIRHGGLQCLVGMCNVFSFSHSNRIQRNSNKGRNGEWTRQLRDKSSTANANATKMRIVACAAAALVSCCGCPQVQKILRDANLMPVLSQNLFCDNDAVLRYTLQILRRCCTDPYFCVFVRSENLLPLLLKKWKVYHERVSTAVDICCILAQCCWIDQPSQDVFRSNRGLEFLFAELKRTATNYQSLEANALLLWRVCCNQTNLKALCQLGNIVEVSLNILDKTPIEYEKYQVKTTSISKTLTWVDQIIRVNTYLVGALTQFSNYIPSRAIIIKEGGIGILLRLLKYSSGQLTLHIIQTLGNCACSCENIDIILEENFLTRLFSYLLLSDAQIVTETAKALARCFQANHIFISMTMGITETIVLLLRSDNVLVLIAVLELISALALCDEQLTIMSEMKLVAYFPRLLGYREPNLVAATAKVIALVVRLPDNMHFVKQLRLLPMLVDMFQLFSDQPVVAGAITLALCQLSKDPHNAVMLKGYKKIHGLLIEMVKSNNEDEASAAATTLNNIRQMTYILKAQRTQSHDFISRSTPQSQ